MHRCRALRHAVFLMVCGLTSHALGGSTSGSETVNIGDLYTSNWRSGDFAGTALRTWNAAADSFSFTWTTTAGDQIGRIGKSHASRGFGVRVDDVRDNCVMSTSGEMRNLVSSPTGFYIYAIYGWTHEQNSGWPSPNGWNNEFYVIFQRQLNLAPGSGNVSIGSVTIDGAVFDCYTNDMPWGTPNQTQYLAVARNRTWSASVDLKKVFAYWRTKGLPNEYVVDLTWALEAGPGSGGELVLSNVNIPALARTSKVLRVAGVHGHGADGAFSVWLLNGRSLPAVAPAAAGRAALMLPGSDGNGERFGLTVAQRH